MLDRLKFMDENAQRIAISDDEIAAVQEKYQLNFPEIFIQYLKLWNGIPVKRCDFTVLGNHFCLIGLCGIRNGGLAIEKVMESDFVRFVAPKGWIPIGLDLTGDYFFCDPVTEAVYSISNHRPEPLLAADSLLNFWATLENSQDHTDPSAEESA